uniref:Uncharacterized protein n=1 Tax=Arundo donax TaxID=35708 RepID=A0A0A9BY36_ARUDO
MNTVAHVMPYGFTFLVPFKVMKINNK